MLKFGNLSFGLNAVQAGQKSNTVNAEPTITACSSQGKFTITSPVSKAMGVAVGENVFFLNNIRDVELAVSNRVEDIVKYAEEKGIDIDSREGQDQLVKDFSTWFIAKGIQQFNSKGEPLMASVRMTKEDKQAYIDKNSAQLVKDFRDILIERNGGEDADDETLAALITVDDIESPQIPSFTGSKTSTTGNATGVGCQLSFTDTSIWTSLKSDIEDKTKVNRVFKVLLEEAVTTNVFDGQKEVEVIAYPIEFSEDTTPIVREKKD